MTESNLASGPATIIIGYRLCTFNLGLSRSAVQERWKSARNGRLGGRELPPRGHWHPIPPGANGFLVQSLGYRTRPADGVEKMLPEFKAPSHYRDAAKIAEYVATQKAEFLTSAKDMPYTGTFDEVELYDPRNGKSVMWKYPTVEETKPPVSVRVKNYLLKNYPDAWDNITAA